MKIFQRLFAWVSSLPIAITLLLVIAFASGLGTAIPQGEAKAQYLENYSNHPIFGVINGDLILNLQLDHIYTSNWFLFLLTWLGIALIICSWRRQLPSLQSALKWIDYREPRQLSKLAIAKTISVKTGTQGISVLAAELQKKGWQVQKHPDRLAARKGLLGKIGPPLVHIGMVVLMIGAVWGALAGQRIERFLSPGRSFELLNQDGVSQLTLNLKSFKIDRDPTGVAEQFRSEIELIEEGEATTNIKEISVNHPLRYRGMTIYQADWALAGITIQLGQSPQFQFPLKSFPELGTQNWGVVIPTSPDGSNPVLISLSNEMGPIQVFDDNGQVLASLRPGSQSVYINDLPLRVLDVIPSSGLLLKRDPGVPLVYTGFAVTMLGGGLSVIATKQLWAVSDSKNSSLHVGGLCNRNLTGFANELPQLLKEISIA